MVDSTVVCRDSQPAHPRKPTSTIAAFALVLLLLLGLPAQASASRGGASRYPAGATRPQVRASRAQLTHAAKSTKKSRRRKRRKPRGPVLHGDPARALLGFEAMQRHYYIPGSGLYEGEPFSFLWPFSQALGATVGMAEIPALKGKLNRELNARLVGLGSYLDTNNSGDPEGTYVSTLAAYDGTVAPPAGPGGAKYYDDNDWVGIELMRLYGLQRNPAMLGAAEGIMAFEMQGWQTNPELGCSGGIPFSNAVEETDRNTITTAPAAELALQLYKATGQLQYLYFAQQAYEWVRRCLLQPDGLYGDHVNRRGVVQGGLWSYTQGSMIGAAALLYRATGYSGYLDEARQTVAAALAYFTPARLAGENPFFPFVYFRNLMYFDSVTREAPGSALAQAYVNTFWGALRLGGNLFVWGEPPAGNLLVQASIVEIYALLSSPPSTYF